MKITRIDIVKALMAGLGTDYLSVYEESSGEAMVPYPNPSRELLLPGATPANMVTIYGSLDLDKFIAALVEVQP